MRSASLRLRTPRSSRPSRCSLPRTPTASIDRATRVIRPASAPNTVVVDAAPWSSIVSAIRTVARTTAQPVPGAPAARAAATCSSKALQSRIRPIASASPASGAGAALGSSPRDDDAPVGLAARTELGGRRDVHRRRAAPGGVHEHLAAPRPDTEQLGPNDLVVVGERLAGEQIGERQVGVVGDAEVLTRRGVEVEDATPRVADPDEVAGLLHERLQLGNYVGVESRLHADPPPGAPRLAGDALPQARPNPDGAPTRPARVALGPSRARDGANRRP